MTFYTEIKGQEVNQPLECDFHECKDLHILFTLCPQALELSLVYRKFLSLQSDSVGMVFSDFLSPPDLPIQSALIVLVSSICTFLNSFLSFPFQLPLFYRCSFYPCYFNNFKLVSLTLSSSVSSAATR